MAVYDEELLEAARRLLTRSQGQRGRLPGALIRRSISTAYYALFHFMAEESAIRVLGADNDLRRRRRMLVRVFSHSGIKTAFGKVSGTHVDTSVEDFLRAPSNPTGRVPSPIFVQDLATVFLDARTKREDADYDLNEQFNEWDAKILLDRIESAINGWRAANSAADKDFKHALGVLMLIKGQFRRET